MLLSTSRYVIVFFFLSVLSCSSVRDPAARTIYSSYVKDSFGLYIDLPEGYKKGGNYSVVFYMDANLKSGIEWRRQSQLDSNKSKLSKVISVGIGHIGDYQEKRRRDLIPFVLQGKDTIPPGDPSYGHAEQFYQFLTKELIPLVNKEYPNNGRFTYIGHSFGGLFGFYCFLKPEPVFKNIVALSPSLWVNYNNFFEHEALFSASHYRRDVTLFHACGTAEWINKVLYSSRRMKDTLNRRNYAGMNYIYKEFEGKSHNGVVPVSFEYVISNIRF